MKRVEVWWTDAAHHHPGDWGDAPKNPRCTVRTVGFLLSDKRDHLTLAQSRQGESFTGVFTIPTACVVKVKRLG